MPAKGAKKPRILPPQNNPVVKRAKIKDNKEDDEDLLAPPKSSTEDEDSSTDDERSRSASIKPTVFGTDASKQAILGKGRDATTSGVSSIAGSRPIRGRKTIPNSSGSPKRKSQEDPFPTSSGDIDLFGDYHTTKKKKNTAAPSYGRSTQNNKGLSSSQAIRFGPTQDNEDSPQKNFNMPAAFLTPEKAKPQAVGLVMPAADFLESPVGTPGSTKHTDTASKNLNALKDAIADSDDDTTEYAMSQLQGLDSNFDSPPAKVKQRDPDLDKYYEPMTQAPEFNLDYLDDSGLLSQAQEIVRQDRDIGLGAVQNYQSADYAFTQTQIPSNCPMCHAPVDPEELKARGTMNLRAQEQFCQSHQRKTAKEDWEERGYPDINWENLPIRLSKFQKKIEKWIRGEDSHFRRQYGATVDAGKDRSLKKLTSNLTPGYYGSRGLQVIAEFVMQNHTRRLKKMAPKDTLMSKRGVAAYVQAVLVQEIATLLIMEDMKVDEEKAREILGESVLMGILLQEEEKDVHVRGVDDTEDEYSSDELA